MQRMPWADASSRTPGWAPAFSLLLVALCACASGSSSAVRGEGGSDGDEFANAPGQSGESGAASLPGGSAAGSASSGVGTGNLPRGCNDLVVQFDPVTPTVLLLIDRSGSMWDSSYGDSPTRWQAVYDALMNADGVVQPLASEVRFGLMTYTGESTGGTCPSITSVAPTLDNYAPVKEVYDAASPRPTFKAETPTGPGVRAAIDALLEVTEDGPKYIVLVTDGEPDTCATPDPQCGQDESIAAVQAAFEQGIATFVIGISSDVGTAHLQDVANAGAGLPVRAPDMQFMYNCVNPGYAVMSASYAAAGQTPGSAPVHEPADRGEIADTIGSLIRGVHGCSYTLNAEVDLTKAGQGRVLLDAEILLYEDENGWRMLDSRTLEVTGAACDRVLSDASELAISFPCDVAEVI
jgi:hypothetical protein